MKARLTATFLKGLEVDRKKDYRIWDSNTDGLYIHILPTGKKVFRFYYRRNQKPRTITIGTYGTSYTLEQAKIAVQVYRGQLARGLDPMEEKQAAIVEEEQNAVGTMRDFMISHYTKYLTTHNTTGADTAEYIKKLWPDFLDRPMGDIQRMDIDDWITKQAAAKVNPATINRKLNDLGALFSEALRRRVIDTNPCVGVKRPKEKSDPIKRYLTKDEETRLREMLETRDATAREKRASANEWRKNRDYELMPELIYADHLTPLVLLSINTGARRGELFKLDWRNVNTDKGMILISATTTKTGTGREVFLNDEALDVFEKWGKQTTKTGLVFPNPNTGGQLTTIKTAWGKLLRDASIENFRWHDLRHTFASRLVAVGVDLVTVKDLMGHAQLSTTQRYLHTDDERKAAAVRKLLR